MLTTLLLLGSGAVSDAPASAPLLVDLFVDGSASNCAAATGTAAAPYCTIADALAVAVAGDVIRIAPGTYNERISVANNIRLVGDAGAAATIIDGGAAGTVLTIEATASAVVEGLTITNGAGESAGVLVEGSGTLRNTTITDNRTTIGYGAAGIDHVSGAGPLLLENCTVTNNGPVAGSYAYSYAGGLQSRAGAGGFVTIRNSTFAGNSSEYAGGVYTYGSNISVEGTTFSGNSGSSAYGALDVVDADLVLVNSTISGNTNIGLSLIGGSYAAPSVRSTTIFGNSDDGISTSFAQSPEITNSIIAGNSGDDVGGQVTSVGFNLIGDDTGSTGFGPQDLLGTTGAPLDPLLGPLAANGGPTETHALLPGSPAIGAGDQSFFEPTDQRGVQRIAGAVDIGAFQSGGGIGSPVPGCIGLVNSAGLIGRTDALGSDDVALNSFVLRASSLPPNQFGIFVISLTPGSQPVGNGNLCLSGSIGRYDQAGQIMSSGPGGTFSLGLDLTQLRLSASIVAAQPGETWYFQTWHRDGGQTSNFAEATQVTFN